MPAIIGRHPFVRVLLALILAVPIVAEPAPASATTAGDVAWPYVYRVGGELYLEDEPFQFSGLNLYYANNLRNDGCTHIPLGAGGQIDATLADWGQGMNVMRSWFFQNLAQTDLAVDGGVRDWSAFDHTLAAADAAGLKVIATLTDQWGECGDFGLNGFKTQTWYESGYRDAVDPGNLVTYREWVREIVTRYRDDPRIAFWQLANEAEVKTSAAAGCPADNGPAEILKAWAADVSSLVKSIDPNHLVSLGTMGGGQCGAQGDQYRFVHDLPSVDLCEYHDYSPGQPMPGDQWNGLAVRIDQCAALDKPLFVGEVGIRPTDVGSSLEDRAAALDAKLRVQRAAGIDGHVVWAWSVNGSTLDNYDIGAGDPILGVIPHAPPTSTEPVSISSAGELGNSHSGNGVGDTVIGGDGRFVAFTSDATNLASGSAVGLPNVLVRDRARGTTEVAAIGLGGATPNSFSHAPALSDSGRFVAFLSAASNLVAGDTNGLMDVFVRDRVRGITSRLSVASDGSQMVGDSAFGTPDISADGRYVVFTAQGGGLVPEVPVQGFSRAYLHDRDADADGMLDEPEAIVTRQVSVTSDGSLANAASYRASISSSGRFVAFHSEAGNLVPGDTVTCGLAEPTPSASAEPEPGPSEMPPSEARSCTDIFVLDRDVDVDAAFDEPGATSLELVSRLADGTQADNDSFSAALADDGDVAFGTVAPNFGSDGNPAVIVRDHQTGAIALAGTSLGNLASISADGRVVGYDSYAANGTADATGSTDAFVHDRATGINRILNVGTDGAQTALGAFLPTFSRDGRFVSFISAAPNLVDGDSNGFVDVFVRDLAEVPPPPGLTPAGTNVTVQPVFGGNGATPVTVTFANLTSAGVTTLSSVSDIQAAPTGFSFGDPPLAWDVSTTASFTGLVTVCFTYDEGQVSEPDGRLFHLESGTWVDVTASLDPDANLLCGSATSLSPFVAGTPAPLSVFIETNDLDSYDHGVLWVTEVIDPTSVPQPADFSLTIDGIPEPVLDVEFVYQGLVGSPLMVELLGFTRGSAFLEVRWATEAAPDAEILLSYTPSEHPIRTPDGRELPAFADSFLERVDASDFGLPFVDEGAGPEQLVLFLAWRIGDDLPAADDFMVSASSWDGPQPPTLVRRRAEHLGATFLYLELPQAVQPGDTVALTYTEGANPLVNADGTPLGSFEDAEVQVSLATSSSRTTPPGDDVTVTPTDNETGGTFATIQFDSVTGGGTTTLRTTETAPPLPAGFTVGDPPTYYEIETTATFEGSATVCIRYGAADYTDPGELVLLHFEEGAWVLTANQTHDPATQTICGEVTSFSPFAVAQSGYDFAGFFAPVDNPPVVNVATGGRAIPVKFSLGGDFGLEILAATPVTRRVACDSGAPLDTVEETVGTSGPVLSYDVGSDRYQLAWKTQKSWAGSCRELVLTFVDGSTQAALFRFK